MRPADVSSVADEDVDRIAGLCRLLSDQTRLKILLLLAGGQRNVTRLCQETGLVQPTVSHHLGLLRTHNLIVSRRSGKQIIYGLSPQVQADEKDVLRVDLAGSALRFSISRSS